MRLDLPVRVIPGLPENVAGLPVNVPGMPFVELPAVAVLHKV
jgi:hypothetical protein